MFFLANKGYLHLLCGSIKKKIKVAHSFSPGNKNELSMKGYIYNQFQ